MKGARDTGNERCMSVQQRISKAWAIWIAEFEDDKHRSCCFSPTRQPRLGQIFEGGWILEKVPCAGNRGSANIWWFQLPSKKSRFQVTVHSTHKALM
jgi:hypothetical protein